MLHIFTYTYIYIYIYSYRYSLLKIAARGKHGCSKPPSAMFPAKNKKCAIAMQFLVSNVTIRNAHWSFRVCGY